jgi:pyrimidine-specific ribonucleoside hydrolase
MARPLIIDTDAGYDDLLAILYLLGDSSLEIEAITVVSGLTTNLPLAGNVLRYVLEYTGRPGIPVYLGSADPWKGGHRCPAAWTNKIGRLEWPHPAQPVESGGAVDFLARKFAESAERQMLALGPLTNIAGALELHHNDTLDGPPTPIQLTIMGGAFGVDGEAAQGNMEGADPSAPNSEFNIYLDPAAARRVLQPRTFEEILLVPLNACSMVPIDECFIKQFQHISSRRPETELVKLVLGSILENNQKMKGYFAWDPLTAMPAALEKPYSSWTVDVDHLGVTTRVSDAGPVSVALKANPARFRSGFFARFM